jgi:hypothetical protein
MRGRLEQEVMIKIKAIDKIKRLKKNLLFKVIRAPSFIPQTFLLKVEVKGRVFRVCCYINRFLKDVKVSIGALKKWIK